MAGEHNGTGGHARAPDDALVAAWDALRAGLPVGVSAGAVEPEVLAALALLADDAAAGAAATVPEGLVDRLVAASQLLTDVVPQADAAGSADGTADPAPARGPGVDLGGPLAPGPAPQGPGHAGTAAAQGATAAHDGTGADAVAVTGTADADAVAVPGSAGADAIGVAGSAGGDAVAVSGSAGADVVGAAGSAGGDAVAVPGNADLRLLATPEPGSLLPRLRVVTAAALADGTPAVAAEDSAAAVAPPAADRDVPANDGHAPDPVLAAGRSGGPAPPSGPGAAEGPAAPTVEVGTSWASRPAPSPGTDHGPAPEPVPAGRDAAASVVVPLAPRRRSTAQLRAVLAGAAVALGAVAAWSVLRPQPAPPVANPTIDDAASELPGEHGATTAPTGPAQQPTGADDVRTGGEVVDPPATPQDAVEPPPEAGASGPPARRPTADDGGSAVPGPARDPAGAAGATPVPSDAATPPPAGSGDDATTGDGAPTTAAGAGEGDADAPAPTAQETGGAAADAPPAEGATGGEATAEGDPAGPGDGSSDPAEGGDEEGGVDEGGAEEGRAPDGAEPEPTRVAPAEPTAAAEDDMATTIRDTGVEVDVAANDATAGGEPVLTIATGPLDGVADVVGPGRVAYVPDPGFEGTDRFVYRVCVEDACDTAAVTVEVEAPPEPPVATDDRTEVRVGGEVLVAVLANDDDREGDLDPSTLRVVVPPERGVAEVEGVRVRYAAGGDPGGDELVYEVCDRAGACDRATVHVDVLAANRAPEARDDELVLDGARGTARVLANDTDPDDGADGLDPTTLRVVDGPAQGRATVDDGAVTYAADGDGPVDDRLVYEVCDGAGACATAVLTVTRDG